MFAKRLKKQFLSINNSIESFFNQIKQLFEKIKKTKFNIQKIQATILIHK